MGLCHIDTKATIALHVPMVNKLARLHEKSKTRLYIYEEIFNKIKYKYSQKQNHTH